MAETTHSNASLYWLILFFVCFVAVMAIGAFAIFTYDANAPEKAPSPGGAHSMRRPEDSFLSRRLRVIAGAVTP